MSLVRLKSTINGQTEDQYFNPLTGQVSAQYDEKSKTTLHYDDTGKLNKLSWADGNSLSLQYDKSQRVVLLKSKKGSSLILGYKSPSHLPHQLQVSSWSNPAIIEYAKNGRILGIRHTKKRVVSSHQVELDTRFNSILESIKTYL
jgi:hypothetical protein